MMNFHSPDCDRLFLLILSVQIHFLVAYPQFPSQYAAHPSMPSMVGMEPIMPSNFPVAGLGRHLPAEVLSPPNPMLNNSPLYLGRDISGFGAGSAQPMNSLFIRNSPYQMPIPTMPGASPFSLNQQQMSADRQLQQSRFPNGMPIDNRGVLPSDIPMDVLVGRQINQNRFDEMSQSMGDNSAPGGGRHPFPLGPFLGPGAGRGTSPFVEDSFGADVLTKGMASLQYGHDKNTMQQQLVAPPWSMPTHKISPQLALSAPASMPQHAPSAETFADQNNSNSLPVFLRGAPSDQIDEFKRIIRQPNGTYGEQVRLIDTLVQRMEPKRQMMYREFMRENDEREHSHRDRVHKTVEEMSEKAQEQFAKISATLRNPSVPDQERWDRVLQLYEKMEPELRNEFEQQFKGFAELGTKTNE